jgi:E3 ubiquitin-protein ligase BRE1
LEAEIKKLEQEVNRLRQGRDSLQKSLDSKLAKESFEMKQLEEIKCISESRKDRIDSLESELTRFKMKIASNMEHYDLGLLLDSSGGEPLDLVKELS